MDLTESFIDLTILNDYGMRQKDWGGRGREIDKCFQCLNTKNCEPQKNTCLTGEFNKDLSHSFQFRVFVLYFENTSKEVFSFQVIVFSGIVVIILKTVELI